MTAVRRGARAYDAADLLRCCGSTRWATALADGDPYPDLDALLLAGARTWWSLDADAWREAWAAHPRIGAAVPAGTQEAGEQRSAQVADASVLAELAAGNDAYERRFGYTYVVRATGRSAQEMLRILLQRLASAPEEELRTAAAEQWEITALRLRRLWDAGR